MKKKEEKRQTVILKLPAHLQTMKKKAAKFQNILLKIYSLIGNIKMIW